MFEFGDEKWPGLACLNGKARELSKVVKKLEKTPDSHDLRVQLIGKIAAVKAALFFVTDTLTNDDRAQIDWYTEDNLLQFEKWHEENKASNSDR